MVFSPSLRKMLVWSSLLFSVFIVISQVRAQSGTQGFISIDCGLTDGNNYTDNTNIFYVSDSQYIDTGMNSKIASNYVDSSVPIQDLTVRSFPAGARNCYTLKPAEANQKYLLRATFLYGNYDGLQSVKANSPLMFDLHIGVNLWKTANISDASTEYRVEAITFAVANFVSVCLINTGFGTPFISALEMRPFKSTMYPIVMANQSLVLYLRRTYTATANKRIRFPDDPYDRLWSSYTDLPAGWTTISGPANATIQNYQDDYFLAPSAALRTAVTLAAWPNSTALTAVQWDAEPAGSTVPEYYAVFFFTELQQLNGGALRQFDIYFDGSVRWFGGYTPPYLASGYVYSNGAMYGYSRYAFSLNATGNATLPPILNAFEIYSFMFFPNPITDLVDVDAMMTIKAQYKLKKNWMGDPCTPTKYAWDGLNCSYTTNSSRIISINLSSSGLTGPISDSFSLLQAIKYLDLSNNSLTGVIPDSLANLSSLQILNLTNNNLTEPVPDALLRRAKAGSLILRVDDYLIPCTNASCWTPSPQIKKKISTPIILIVSLVPAFVLAVLLVALCIICRKPPGQSHNIRATQNIEVHPTPPVIGKKPSMPRRRFMYMELRNITNNFSQVIGKGGFGVVYLGYLDNEQEKNVIEVAVKVCHHMSSQGTKQLLAEAESLMHVYHKNLVSLVGYCMDGDKLGLVYEYMPQGSLHDHLRGKSGVHRALNWGERLRIALEAAQGLDYLHTGCKIVHRDVKTSNILLGKNLEAKIADFGLAKMFDDNEHVSLMSVSGTPGYIDPESSRTLQLTAKSDVYSFGVVLLEIITGKPPILQGQGRENIHLVKHVSQFIARGDINEIVDSRLQGEYNLNSVWKVADAAMRCTAETSVERPTMTELVVLLKDSFIIETARAKSKSSYGESSEMSQISTFGITTTSIGPSAR